MVVASSGKKIDITKQGLNSIENETVKLNLMGKSKSMESKDWRDSQGRKGKVRRPALHPWSWGGASGAALPLRRHGAGPHAALCSDPAWPAGTPSSLTALRGMF